MLDTFNINDNSLVNQVFYHKGANAWQVWHKPPNCNFINFYLLGGGAGGQGGFTGNTGTVRNGGTGGAYKMQYTITATNAVSYTIVIRYGTTTATANTFSNTVSSTPIQTSLGSTINDYYILEITPWSGASGTGSAGVQRTTTIKRNVGTPITNTTNNS